MSAAPHGAPEDSHDAKYRGAPGSLSADMGHYVKSMMKKMDRLLWGKEISGLIWLHDKADGQRLDQVVFLKKADGCAIGFYADGMNPLISSNRVDESDDFNLYASYDELIETEEKDSRSFRIDNLKLYFNARYNELMGLYLSDDLGASLLIVFLDDEIHVIHHCKKSDVDTVFKEKKIHIPVNDIFIYERTHAGWTIQSA